MKITSNVIFGACVVAVTSVGFATLGQSAVIAQNTTSPRTNPTASGGILSTKSKVIPATRSTELRAAMQRLTVDEQKTLTRALNKLTPEERRVLAKAMDAPEGTTSLTPPNPPVPPTSPLNPVTSSRTGQGSSGTGTLPPR